MTLPTIPIDTGRLTSLLCVSLPEPRADFTTGEARTDRATGLPEYVVGVLAKIPGDRRAFVLDVRVPGNPAGLIEGQPVTLHNLTGSTWSQNGRNGVSYRADEILPATPATPPASAPASAAPEASSPAGSPASGRNASRGGGGSS